MARLTKSAELSARDHAAWEKAASSYNRAVLKLQPLRRRASLAFDAATRAQPLSFVSLTPNEQRAAFLALRGKSKAERAYLRAADDVVALHRSTLVRVAKRAWPNCSAVLPAGRVRESIWLDHAVNADACAHFLFVAAAHASR